MKTFIVEVGIRQPNWDVEFFKREIVAFDEEDAIEKANKEKHVYKKFTKICY